MGAFKLFKINLNCKWLKQNPAEAHLTPSTSLNVIKDQSKVMENPSFWYLEFRCPSRDLGLVHINCKAESGWSQNDSVELKWQFSFSCQERPLFRKDHHNLFHQALSDSGQPVSIFLFLSLNNVWIILPFILGHVDWCLYAHCNITVGSIRNATI